MKVLVVDDDISFVTELRMKLEYFGVQMIRTETTEGGAITAVIEFEPDVVVCDINLNGHESGVVLSEFLSSRHIPFVIITQFKNDELFEKITIYEPIAYFTKPVDYVALKFALNSMASENAINLSGEELMSDPLGHYIFIRKRSKYEKVKFSDIYFLNAEGNYVTFFCTDQKFVVRSSLKRCLEKISDKFFIQIHRKYVVNYHRIDSISINENTLTVGRESLPIGRSFKTSLLDHLPLL